LIQKETDLFDVLPLRYLRTIERPQPPSR
jgi:hypothetical protein